jgi:hypothetical protein
MKFISPDDDEDFSDVLSDSYNTTWLEDGLPYSHLPYGKFESFIDIMLLFGAGDTDDISSRIQLEGLAKRNYLKTSSAGSIESFNVNSVFEAHFEQKIDKAFVTKVLQYVDGFIKKNPTHIAFFGGNLIGVYPIKYLTTEDGFTWIEDILAIDDWDKLTKDVHSLPEIDKTRHVSSNLINLSLLWITHKALVSDILTEELRHRLAIACLNMLQYKFITSLHHKRFPHPANEEIALAVYESLDLKFQLKRLGSWQGLVEYNSEKILAHTAKHYHTLKDFNDDREIVLMVNDISTKVRSVVQTLTDRFYEIHKSDARIATTSKYMQVDGESILKDYVNHYSHIKSVMHNVVPDKLSFIREEITTIITDIVSTVYGQYLTTSLEFISNNYHSKYKVDIPELVDDILMFVFDMLKKERTHVKHLTEIATTLLPLLRSSRLISPAYKDIKERLDVLINSAIPKISEVDAASTKIGIVMYITIRAFIETK